MNIIDSDIEFDWTWSDLFKYFDNRLNMILELGTKSWRIIINNNCIIVLYSTKDEYRNNFKDYPILKIKIHNTKCCVKFMSEDDESSKLYHFNLNDLITESLKEVPFEYSQKAHMFISVIKTTELEGD